MSKTSILSAVAVSYDRYRAIVHCLHYSQKSDVSYAVKGLGMVWGMALVFSLLPVVGWGRMFYDERIYIYSINWSHDPAYTVCMVICCFLVPFCIMLVSYSRVTQIARQHLCRIANITQRQGPEVESQSSINISGPVAFAVVDPVRRLSLFPSVNLPGDLEPRQLAYLTSVTVGDRDSLCHLPKDMNIRKLRSTGRLMRLLVVLLVCWMPYYIAVMCEAGGHTVPGSVYFAVYVLALFSTFLNPVVYAFCSRRFRKAITRLVKRDEQSGQNQNLLNLYTVPLSRRQDDHNFCVSEDDSAQPHQIDSAEIPGPSQEFLFTITECCDSNFAVPQLRTFSLPLESRRASEDSAYCDWSRRTSDTSYDLRVDCRKLQVTNV